MMENGYSVFPCANYRYIAGPRSPGCKKRIPAPQNQAQRDERRKFYEAVWQTGPYDDDPTTVNDWQNLHSMGSDVRVEVRIGGTLSLTGSLADGFRNRVITETMSAWVSAMSTDPVTCFSICAADDESSLQRARSLYTGFFDWRNPYDVDFILGPASYELREVPAFLANIFQKPLLLWSAPSSWYTLGQGPTRDPGTAIEDLPYVIVEIFGTNWAPRTQGAAVYVSYHQIGGQSGGRTEDEVALQGSVLQFKHTGKVELWSREPIQFELMVDGDVDEPTGVTQVYGTFEYDDLEDYTRVEQKIQLYDALESGGALRGRWLDVRMFYVRNTWERYFGDFADNYTKLMRQQLTELEQAERQVLEDSSVSVSAFKYGHTGTFSGPNTREADFGGGLVQQARQQEMEALAATVQEEPRQQPGSIWRVKGPCNVDPDDCLTSPGYPGHYGNSQVCVATVDLEAAALKEQAQGSLLRLALTDMDTERLHDLLWISGAGRFHSGQDDVKNMEVQNAGLIVWQSDLSKTARGWRLCSSEFTIWQIWCAALVCPVGKKPIEPPRAEPCAPFCTEDICCQESEPTVEGHLWEQGYGHVFDITPPRETWLTDALDRLHLGGARSLWVSFTAREQPLCFSMARRMRDIGWDVSGSEVLYGATDWFDAALEVDIANMDVLLICGDAMVVNFLLSGLVTLRATQKAILLAEPLGSSLQGNTGPAARMNYILEPLPWPSVEWMMQRYRESYVQWVSFLITQFEVPSLLTFQLQSVSIILSLVTNGLSSANASVVEQRLQILGSSDLPCPTLFGDIRFGPTGQRVGEIPVATTQRNPLLKVQASDSPSIAWHYWRARSLFSQHMIVVNSTEETSSLLRSLVNQAHRTQPDFVLGIPNFNPPETVLRSPMATPRDDFFAELVYPRPSWEANVREVYPCPMGCQNDGHQCQACPPGKFRSFYEEQCRDCEEGRQTPMWASSICPPCPPGGICTGKPWEEIGSQPGFWRAPHEQAIPTGPDSCTPESGLFPEQLDEDVDHHADILGCSPLSWLCLGGAADQCYGDNSGVLCRMCPEGYSWMHYGKGQVCLPCPSDFAIAVQILGVAMAYATICFLLNQAVRYGAHAANSLMLPLLRLLFEHFTTQNMIIESMGLGKSNNEFLPITDMLTRPTEITSVDCLQSRGTSISATNLKMRGQLEAALWLLLGGFAAVPLIFVARLALAFKQSPASRQKDSSRDLRLSGKLSARLSEMSGGGGDKYSRVENLKLRGRLVVDAMRHFCIWLYVSFPCMLRVGIRPLVCIDAGFGDGRVESFPIVSCTDPEYLEMVRPMAVSVVVLYVVVVPCLFFCILYKVSGFANEVSCLMKFGLFSQGYRREYFWFEIILIFRWVVQVLATLIEDVRLRAVVALVLFIGIESVEEQMRPFVPLDRDALRQTFEKSFKVHLVTLSLGMVRMLASDVRDIESATNYVESIDSYEVTLVILITTANILFFLWVVYTMCYNYVVVPLARIASATGLTTLSPRQQFIVKLARRMHGENSIRVMSSERQFSLELVKLDDYERCELVGGIMSCAQSVLVSRQWRFCTAWILQVLRAAFRMVHDDHKARLLERGSRGIAWSPSRLPTRLGHGDWSARTSTRLNRAGTWLQGQASGGKLLTAGRSLHQSYYDVDIRDNTLVDEIIVALNYVGLDLEDGIISLMNFSFLPQKGGRLEKTREPALDFPQTREDTYEDEGLHQTYFQTWRSEIGDKCLLPRIEEHRKHKKPTGAEVLSMMGKTSSLDMGTLRSLRRQGFLDFNDDEDDDDDDDDDDTYDEDEEAAGPLTTHERRMQLQRLILEANVELQEMRLQLRLQNHDADYKDKTHGNFLEEHTRFARPHSHRTGAQRMVSRSASLPTAAPLTPESTDLDVETNSQDVSELLALQDHAAAAETRTIITHLQEESDEWRAKAAAKGDNPLEDQTDFNRKEGWYGPFAVNQGGGGPADLPKASRVPLPPPSAPPSARDKRVIIVKDEHLPIDTSVGDDDPPQVPPVLAAPSFSSSELSTTETPSDVLSDIEWGMVSQPGPKRRAARASAIVAPSPRSGKIVMSL